MAEGLLDAGVVGLEPLGLGVELQGGGPVALLALHLRQADQPRHRIGFRCQVFRQQRPGFLGAMEPQQAAAG